MISNIIVENRDNSGQIQFRVTYTSDAPGQDGPYLLYNYNGIPGNLELGYPYGYENVVRSITQIAAGVWQTMWISISIGLYDYTYFLAGVISEGISRDNSTINQINYFNFTKSNISVTDIGADTATIGWTLTPSGSASYSVSDLLDAVNYGISTPDENSTSVNTSSLSPSIVLSGLNASTNYLFNVSSLFAAGSYQAVCGAICSGSFTTLSPPPPPPDIIIQGLVRKAPTPQFYQDDINIYLQSDKEYLSTDISGPQFR